MMSKKLRLLVMLTTLWMVAMAGQPAQAQDPVGPLHTDPTWQASYWNNPTLYGTPVLQRNETSLDYDWGNGSPAAGVINADGFSARWTRYIDVAPGSYRFTAVSDDGMRVWIDNELIVDAWNDHAPQTFTADRNLSGSHHLLVVEFYENGGGAVARLNWTSGSTNIRYWRGEYYNSTTPSGTPAMTRDDEHINFNWGSSSPDSRLISADRFSARWVRTLDMPAGNYRFTMTVDDGGRLWVNGHLLIDAWRDQAPQTYSGDIYLPGGAILVEMHYYENSGDATARLSWTVGETPPAPGSVIVDDTDTGFVKGGSTSGWHTADEGYEERLMWTRNNDSPRGNYNWARWYPDLTAGWYEVFVYIPERYTTTSNATYWIAHADGYTSRSVDQSAHGGQWVSLGKYYFQGTRQDYVSLNDSTGETRLSRLIAYDAVKWTPSQ